MDSTLDALQPGESGTVQRLKTTTPGVRQRLLEMGLTKGSRVQLLRIAPMGDPIEVSLRGYRLSLRKVEASAVIVHREMA